MYLTMMPSHERCCKEQILNIVLCYYQSADTLQNADIASGFNFRGSQVVQSSDISCIQPYKRWPKISPKIPGFAASFIYIMPRKLA